MNFIKIGDYEKASKVQLLLILTFDSLLIYSLSHAYIQLYHYQVMMQVLMGRSFVPFRIILNHSNVQVQNVTAHAPQESISLHYSCGVIPPTLSMRLLKVATCNLNNWAMDFHCNLKNIKESIGRAKEVGAVIRLGPELEITGYGCEDHFLEQQTFISILT
ncbi:hypothetical protein WN944_019144 [Citrus x changshan-huyou]|uniref:NAD(+) synthase [glutamine-hydrolyzing] n=1 Tax=Citrus x changshan-huyou TaxID=2935761 RepID=A0AAP0QEV2_9ROSI